LGLTGCETEPSATAPQPGAQVILGEARVETVDADFLEATRQAKELWTVVQSSFVFMPD